MKTVKITTEFITLGQLYKLTGIVSSGAEVKYLLKETPAIVNGEVETRRGRKLYVGDIVSIQNTYVFQIG